MSSKNAGTADTAVAAAARPRRQALRVLAAAEDAREEEAVSLPDLCPITATLHLMHEKWTLHIVYVLLSGKKRFNEIGHAIGGVNARTLRERLRSLEAEAIVERRVISAMPPWVEYELTEKGRALSGVMDAMSRWSRQWQDASPPSPLPAQSRAMLCQRDDGSGESDTEPLDG